MQTYDFVKKHIVEHLVRLGLDELTATLCAQSGVEHFKLKVSNSRDPFKDACDHAGEIAVRKNPKFKYKSPSSKRSVRQKRPQEAFTFTGEQNL